MAYDKLSIINSALTRTGNNEVRVEGEGTAEWIVAGKAYDDELPLLLSDHDWGFGSTLVSLERVGVSPHAQWSDQFRRPPNCLHIEAIYSGRDVPMDYDILDGTVLVNSSSCRARIIRQPTPESWPQFFIETLIQRIMAHCYRGLNEDPTEAVRMDAKAEATLDRARARTDQEKPRRAMINSRLLRARGIRRGGMILPRGDLP